MNHTTYHFLGGYEIGCTVTKTVSIYPHGKPTEVLELIITDKEIIDCGVYVQNKFYLSNGEERSIYEFECRYTDDGGEENTGRMDLIDVESVSEGKI